MKTLTITLLLCLQLSSMAAERKYIWHPTQDGWSARLADAFEISYKTKNSETLIMYVSTNNLKMAFEYSKLQDLFILKNEFTLTKSKAQSFTDAEKVINSLLSAKLINHGAVIKTNSDGLPELNAPKSEN